MPRTLGTATKAAIAAVRAAATHLIEFDLDGGTLYFTSGVQQIAADTGDGTGVHTWVPIGGDLKLGAGVESSDLQATGMDIEMALIDQTDLAAFLSANLRTRVVRVWTARLSETTGQLIDPPVLVCEGRLTEDITTTLIRPDKGATTATLRTRITGLSLDLDQVRGIQLNVGSHQSFGFTGDNGMEFVQRMQGRRIAWGSLIIAIEVPPQ